MTTFLLSQLSKGVVIGPVLAVLLFSTNIHDASIDASGNTTTLTVAAADSSNTEKNKADYVCDGIDDQIEIQAAIDALPTNNGKVRLSEGTFTMFNTSVDSIDIADGISIEGTGESTIIRLASGVNADCSIFSATSKKGIIIENLQINGNAANQSEGQMYSIAFDSVSDSLIEVWSKDFTTANFNLVNSQDTKYQNLYWPVPDSKPIECNCVDSIGDQLPHQITLLDDFESGWTISYDSEGSVSRDTAIFHQGDASLKITKPIGFDRVSVTKKVNFNLENIQPSLWVRLDDGVTHLYCSLLAPDWSNYYSCSLSIRSDSPINNTWYRMPINIATAEGLRGTPDISNITTIRIEMIGSTDDQLSTWVDDMCSYPSPTQGKMTLRFDDGLISVYDTAFPIMAEYGYPGVAGLVTSAVDQRNYTMSVDQLTEMQESGWDIVSHSKYHRLTHDSPAGFVDDELRESQSFLIQNGFEKGSRFYIAPQGMGSATIMEKLKQYYCMTSFSNPLMNNAYPYQYIVGGRAVTLDTPTETIKEWIDQANEYGFWLVLMFHRIEDSDDHYAYAIDSFAEIIDYIDSVSIPVVTFSEVYDNLYVNSFPSHEDIARLNTLFTFHPYKNMISHILAKLELYWKDMGCMPN